MYRYLVVGLYSTALPSDTYRYTVICLKRVVLHMPQHESCPYTTVWHSWVLLRHDRLLRNRTCSLGHARRNTNTDSQPYTKDLSGALLRSLFCVYRTCSLCHACRNKNHDCNHKLHDGIHHRFEWVSFQVSLSRIQNIFSWSCTPQHDPWLHHRPQISVGLF